MKKLSFIVILLLISFSSLHPQPTTWLKPFEMPGSINILNKVQQTYDGNFIAVGRAISKIYLVKVNSYGDTLWTRRLGNPEVFYQSFWIENLSDNGNIITGGKGSDIYLLKTDEMGYETWYRFYGGRDGYCVKPTPDGGYIIACRNSYDILVIKTDSAGDVEWQRNYDSGLTSNYPDEIDLFEDGYILVGRIGHLQEISFAWLLRLDSNGDTLWTKRYDNNIPVWTVGIGVQTVSTPGNEGFIVLGRSRNSSGRDVSYIIKTDTSGNIEWDRIYLTYDRESPLSLREIPGKGYVFCGGTFFSYPDGPYKGFIRVIDYEGNVIDEKFHLVPGADYTNFRSVEVSSDGGFILCGTFSYPGGFTNMQMAKTDSAGNIGPVSINQVSSIVPSGFMLNQNYPNPFNPSTKIGFQIAKSGYVTLRVFNIQGKEIKLISNESINPGSYEYIFDPSVHGLASGIYYYQLIVKDQFHNTLYSSSKRIVYLK